jgi:hypothetical protein
MTDAARGFDPQQLWQAQPKALTPLTLGEIHRRARSFRRGALRRRIASWDCVVFAALAMTWRLQKVTSWMMQLGAVLALAGVLFVLWRWQAANTVGPPPDEGEALVAAYRSNLIRLRDARRSVALWYIAPMLPGMALLVLGRWLQRHTPGLPIALDHFIVVLVTTILGLFLVVGYLWSQRQADQLQRRIDEL